MNNDQETTQAMAKQKEIMTAMQEDTRQARSDGVIALQRLVKVAQGSSGQCKKVAQFLLGCYNGCRFPFDLTDFRSLDYPIFRDCMTVLRMDYQPYKEIHEYIENGWQVFEQLAEDWNLNPKPAN